MNRSSSDISISSVSSSESLVDIQEQTVVTTTTVTTTKTTENKRLESSSSSTSSSSEQLPDGVRRVVRKIERLSPRLVHHEEFEIEGSGRVVKEYEFEEQVAVDYTGIREDVVEHIVAIPVVNEIQSREIHAEATRIVEIEKPVTVTKVVDVEQVEIVEQIKEVPTPSGRISKKFNYIPVKKIIPQERKVIIERPVEKVVEVDDITYVDTEEVIETIEIPEYQDVVKIKKVEVPTIIEMPKEYIEEVDCVTDVEVLIPVGVEAETKVQYTVPTIVEKRVSRGYPVYVPRFIEAPTSSIHLSKDQREKSKALLAQMKELELSMHEDAKIVSVCEIEKLGVAARDHQTCIQGHIETSDLKKSLITTFGKSDSTEDGDDKQKKGEEGYYGHMNVVGAWNNLAYDTTKRSHTSSSSISGSKRSSGSVALVQ